MIKSRLKALGQKVFPSQEPDQREQVKDFLVDLKELTTSIETLLDDVSEQFNTQVVEKRGLMQKTLVKLPTIFQSKDLKKEQDQSKEFSTVKSRIHNINVSIDKVEELFEQVPTQEELGQRVYELAYPGEQVTEKRLEEIELRFKEMEEKFFDSVKAVTDQMKTITLSLTKISDQLEEQGIVVNNIDMKLDRVETKMDKALVTLDKISKKITQNKLLIAFLAGVVIFALAVLFLG